MGVHFCEGSPRVRDKVPSANIGVRAAQLNRWGGETIVVWEGSAFSGRRQICSRVEGVRRVEMR